MTIGEIIYQNRKQKELSQEELANMLSVSRQSVSLWETDQSIPTTEKLIALADVFQIGMDELCARTTAPPQNKTEDCIAVSDIAYDEALYKRAYRSAFRLVRNLFLVCLIPLAFQSIAFLLSPIPLTAIGPLLFVLVIIFGLIMLEVKVKKKTSAQMKSQPEHKLCVRFYADRFEWESTSSTSNSFCEKTYDQVKKVCTDDEYFYLQTDNLIVPVCKAALGNRLNAVRGLLGLHPKATLNRTQSRQGRWLLALFVVTCLTLFLAITVIGIVTAINSSPDSFLGNLWIFYCFTPIPIASIVLGEIFLKKGLYCKKNVVAGVIVLFLLAIYGSIPYLMAVDPAEPPQEQTQIVSIVDYEI